jgi:hypothetical protein
VASGIDILGTDDQHASQLTNNIVVGNNLFVDVSSKYGGDGRFVLVTGGGANLRFDHNTDIQDGWTALYADGSPVTAVTFTNNIIPNYGWAIIGGNTAPGNSTIQAYFPGSQFIDNIIAGADPGSYPAGNYYPATLGAVGFVDMAGHNYALSANSPYVQGATDGTAVGCDVSQLPQAAAFGDQPTTPTGVRIVPGA